MPKILTEYIIITAMNQDDSDTEVNKQLDKHVLD